MNTYKHAFDKKETGLISIGISRNNGRVAINYRDNGHGFPEDFDLAEQDSLGFKMIEALTKQLDGTLELYNDEGAHFVITFNHSDKKKREAKPILKR